MKGIDWCRHCGELKEMTEEHIPPKGAGNKQPITVYNDDEDGVLQVIRTCQEGHAVPTLCDGCNGEASRRALPQAYQRWRQDTITYLALLAQRVHQETGRDPNAIFEWMNNDGAFMLPRMEHGGALGPDLVHLHPGRISRQVLGMMLAVQGDRYLLDSAPILAQAYLSDDQASIDGYSLHVAIANAGLAYFTQGALAVTIDRGGRSPASTTPFWAIAAPPFLLMLAEGPDAPVQATRIDQWLKYPRNGTFNATDRRVAYPIADQREPLVAKLYQDIRDLPPDPARAVYDD
jgi:hypothetical protein